MRLNIPSIIGVAGFCSLAVGFLCGSLIFPKLESYLIEKATELKEGSKTFETWKKIPFPFKFKIYFFNVTNPDEVQTGAKPVLKEIGPYIYDEFREREVLSTSDENDTITYIQRKSYYFNDEESGCRSEDDAVTIINFALVSMASKVNKISPMVLPMLNDALPFLYPNIKNVFIKNSVRNILFDGVRIMCDSEEADVICEGVRSKLPHNMKVASNGRDFLLSLFNHVNGTEDGPYEIGRGLKNTVKGKIMAFKEKSLMTGWSTKECNEIQGTDLTVNPRLAEVPEKIDFFVPDFCRYFSVEFNESMEYMDLHTYSFKTSSLFQNRNCSCSQNEKSPECPPTGTMDLTPCSGSPILISQPHFLNAEKFLLSFAQGLKPKSNKHETCIIIEPKTGLALIVRSRFQMSIFLKSYDGIDVLKNVSEGFFPFVWLENGVDVPLGVIKEVQNNFEKLKILDVVKYILIVGGVFLLGVSFISALIKDRFPTICCGKNVISAKRNDAIGRMNMYSDFKINNGSTVLQDYMGRYAWKISE